MTKDKSAIDFNSDSAVTAWLDDSEQLTRKILYVAQLRRPGTSESIVSVGDKRSVLIGETNTHFSVSTD